MTIPSAITQFEKCTHCVAGVGEEPRAVHARQDHQPRRRPWHWLHPQRSGAQVIHILMPFPQKWILAPLCPKQSSRPCCLTSRRARVAGWSKCTTKFDKITYWGKLFLSYPINHMMVPFVSFLLRWWLSPVVPFWPLLVCSSPEWSAGDWRRIGVRCGGL